MKEETSLPLAFNINFDSFNEALGYPSNFRDPSFFEVFDRVEDLANRYEMPLSIYVIGRDLENPEVADRVRDWASAGHEIGNHSWSHHMNLGALPAEKIRDEVLRAHELISSVTGEEPSGFIAPAWSTSQSLLSILIENGYHYDTSLFPSLTIYPIVARIALNHLKKPSRFFRVLSRRDWSFSLTRPNQPFWSSASYKPTRLDKSGIMVLPLPCRSLFEFPFWHTLNFIFGTGSTEKKLKKHLGAKGFYYLTHPADFCDTSDFSDLNDETCLERVNVPIKEKMVLLERVFELLENTGRPFSTMKNLAAELKRRLPSNTPKMPSAESVIPNSENS
tara:strand:- start:1098 stop:2099 length:1002 start_codon:yes stop_codon:yes gene_type:complete